MCKESRKTQGRNKRQVAQDKDPRRDTAGCAHIKLLTPELTSWAEEQVQ